MQSSDVNNIHIYRYGYMRYPQLTSQILPQWSQTAEGLTPTKGLVQSGTLTETKTFIRLNHPSRFHARWNRDGKCVWL